MNPAAAEELVPAQTVQEWITYSDHFPLITHLVLIAEKETETEMAPKYYFNIDLVKGHGKGIVHSNQWSVLSIDPIESVEELDDGAENFCTIVNDIVKDLGIKKQVLGESVFLTQSLKKKVEKATKARHDWERAHNVGSAEEDFLLRRWHLARNAA